MRGQRIVGRRLPASFPPLGIFERTRLAAKGKKVNYRLRTLDLVSRSQARAYCKTASRAGLSCLPIRQTDNTWQLVQTGDNSLVARATVVRPEGRDGKKTTNTTKKQKRVAVVAKPVPKKPARMRPAVLRDGSLVKVQLAAYRNLARALNGKYILAKSLPDNFPALEILKRNGNTDDRTQINYWVRSKGLWQLNRARVLCKMARSAGHGCMLIEPERAARQSVVAHR